MQSDALVLTEVRCAGVGDGAGPGAVWCRGAPWETKPAREQSRRSVQWPGPQASVPAHADSSGRHRRAGAGGSWVRDGGLKAAETVRAGPEAAGDSRRPDGVAESEQLRPEVHEPCQARRAENIKKALEADSWQWKFPGESEQRRHQCIRGRRRASR